MTTTTQDTEVMRFKGPLTDEEMDQILAWLTYDTLEGFIALWNIILGRAGEPEYREHDDGGIKPSLYSIPHAQALTIMEALAPDDNGLHLSWCMAWMDNGPSWHNEEVRTA